MNMIIMGIDPGDSNTGFAFYRVSDSTDCKSNLLGRGKIENANVLQLITKNAGKIKVYIEDIAQYGSIVGKHVFDTIKYIGRIMERCEQNGVPYQMVFRKTIVTHHTDNPKANDTIMKSWFSDNFGDPSKRNKTSPFAGITSDEISAIAIAKYGADMELKNDKLNNK